jgi:hypothetical protein
MMADLEQKRSEMHVSQLFIAHEETPSYRYCVIFKQNRRRLRKQNRTKSPVAREPLVIQWAYAAVG